MTTYAVICEKMQHSGRFRYTVRGTPIKGLSTTPLLDACRKLKSMGSDPRSEILLYHVGRSDWALRTTVGAGAELRVREDSGGNRAGRPIFAEWRPYQGEQ
jgi:hypothetical protein